MIGHDLDPHADHGDPYACCTSISDIERVLAGLPRRESLTWPEAMAAMAATERGETSPLLAHPQLLAAAEVKNRAADRELVAAVERVSSREA